MSELHQAAATGDCDLVAEILRNNKCDPNQRDLDWNNKTPLHWASAGGHTETVRVLVEHGAKLGARTSNGWTPAHFAAEAGRLAVLRLLHSHHAPVDQEDSSGDKPVRVAEIYGHGDCVRFLKKAETECDAYRQVALQEGVALDETDEEREQAQKKKTGNELGTR